MLSNKEQLINVIEQFFKEIIQLKEISDITNYGINPVVWEDFSKELYNKYLRYNFINVNEINTNYPAIDIGDEENSICIQITKNLDRSKINHTIELFEKYKLYEKYNTLQVLLITLDKDLPEFKKEFKTNGKYKFSKENILGLDSIIKDIKNLDISKLQSFVDLCLSYFHLQKITSGKEYINYNLQNNLSINEENLIGDLNIIKDLIIDKKDYVRGLELIDHYLKINNKDLDIAYNLKGVIFFNRDCDYKKSIDYFEKSITINAGFYKGKVNKIKALYQLSINGKETNSKINELLDLIKDTLVLLKKEKELTEEIYDIYGSLLLIYKRKDLFDEYINNVSKLDNFSEFMYDSLFKMYQEIGSYELGKGLLKEGLKKYPNSYYLNLGKIYLDLEELDRSTLRYNIDILPKLNDKQHKKLLKITEKYYDLLENINTTLESEEIKNQKKYQIYLLAFQLGIHDEKRFINLYNSINLSLIDKYLIWKFDLLKINQNLHNKHFEVAYKILEDSIVKDEIPFVEYVKLASIFLYHGGYKVCNDILNNLKYFKDYDVNYIEYWEYLIQSEVLLGKTENVRNYLYEAKKIFKETQYYSTILKIELSINYRNLDTQENIDEFSKSLIEYHKENGDSDIVRLVKIDESKDIIKQLEKQLPKKNIQNGDFNIKNHYLNNFIPHYCLKREGQTYIELLTTRQPNLWIKIGFLDSKKELEMINEKYKTSKYILSYESLFNLNELNLLEYYQLKDLLKNEKNDFELIITRDLFNLIRDELLSKEDKILRKIYNFVVDSKIKVVDHKGKISELFGGGKIKESNNTYRIIPKWLINSISYSKKIGGVFITDDTSNLETSNVYGIDVINSFIINGKKLQNPIFISENKSSSIMNIAKYNYTFISFTSDDLLYIYNQDNELREKVTIYQKYEINSSFFYLCNQIIINNSCNFESFFKVFLTFENNLSIKDYEKARIYLVFFIYIFNGFFKKYISNLNRIKDNVELFNNLHNDLNKYMDYMAYIIISYMKKLRKRDLEKLLDDYKFLSEKDSEFEKGFGTYIPESIEKLIKIVK